MSFLYLRGVVHSVFHRKEETNREGEKYGGTDHVAMMCENLLTSGDVQPKLFEFRTSRPEVFRALQGREVSVAVGVFASGKEVKFFLPKGEPDVFPLVQDVK